MKEFTVSEFRGDCKSVWREVEQNGIAAIKHRDRDDMIIIQKSEWDAMMLKKENNGDFNNLRSSEEAER